MSQSTDSNGPVYCHCNLQANRFTSHTLSNPDRPFYVCPKRNKDKSACSFWKWEDELSTSPTSSQKRPVPDSDDNMIYSTPKRPRPNQSQTQTPTSTRREAILQALQETSPSPSASRNPPPSQQNRLQIINEALTFSQAQANNQEEEEDVFNSSTQSTLAEEDFFRDRSSGSGLITPPSTAPRTRPVLVDETPSRINIQGKGKGKAKRVINVVEIDDSDDDSSSDIDASRFNGIITQMQEMKAYTKKLEDDNALLRAKVVKLEKKVKRLEKA